MGKTFKISEEFLTQIIEKAYDEGYGDGYNELYNQEFIGSNIEDIRPVRGKADVVNEMLTNVGKIEKAIKKATYAYIPAKETVKEYERISKDYILKRISEIIVDKLGVDDVEVTKDASFRDDLGADSLDTVELIMDFEKEFNIEIRDEDAERVRTVGDAVDELYRIINK